MSFTLKSIELNNIKAHEHFIFEPALEGVTSISGENGAGKSTIVDSFAWALYGTRPSGIRNKNLIREGVNPREKPVSVKVTIITGGIEYIIERKMLTEHGGSECNVWGKAEDSDEFSHVVGPAVSHAEKFIRQELGMNEKGFLTSVLIQQKQVDQIVSASPRERGEVIEELTGIASITQAISKANENTRSLQRAASVMQTGDIDTAKNKVEEQKKVCQSLTEKETEAIKIFNQLKREYKELDEQLKLETEKVEKRRQLESKAEQIKSQIDFLKAQAESDIKYIQEYREKHGTTINVSPEESKAKADEVRNKAYKLQSTINELEKELESIKVDLEKCTILIGNYKDIDEAIKDLESLNVKLDELNAEHDKLKSDDVTLSAEIRHSKASHDHIDGENHECPVCKSEIKDPEALKSEIDESITKMRSEQKEIKKSIKKIKDDIKNTEETVKAVSISVEAIKEHERLVERNNEIDSKLLKLNDERNAIAIELKALDDAYNKALKIEADRNALEAAKKRSLTVNTTIQENQSKLEIILNEIKQLEALNDRSYNALVKRVEKSRDRLTSASVAGQELRGRKQLEIERLNDYIDRLKKEEQTLAEYNKIAEQINVSSTAASMLSQFKADRIASSIPTLEFFASDFLSKFTGGAFTALTMDEKFNTFVTSANDSVRPVAQLSGGELSAAAIALRLGIAMLLNSSEKNVIILDEVLVSMDEDRARQIMETISSMSNAQVIFIAHNNDINSVADKTVLVSK